MYTINPWLIFALIICATIIAFAAIYFDHLVEKKSIDANKDNDTYKGNSSNECRLSKKIIKVHRNYIVGFLGLGVIMLLTAKFGGSSEGVFTYLSFASTITSLVLSILAIFVTVHSSADLYKQFTRIDSATETVQNVSDKIGKTLTAIQNTETQLKNTSTGVNSLMNNIVEEVVNRLDVRLKKTENSLSEQIQQQNVNQSNKNEARTNKNLDTLAFVKPMPYNGLLALYACTKGIEAKKEFALKDLFKENELYYVGVLVTAISAGYIDGTVLFRDNQYYVNGTKTILKSSEILDTLKAYNPDDPSLVEKHLNPINDYFSKQ